MKLLRTLALICFSLGLFVQVAAQAAAPQGGPADMAECAEMAKSAPEQTGSAKIKFEGRGSCSDMTLGCLVAMNCVPALALSADCVLGAAPALIAQSFDSAPAGWLESEPELSEAPPPKHHFCV